jgi:beta-glucosidase
MLVCLLVPTLVYLFAVQEPAPRWRAAYFDNARFEGAAEVREERDVGHDWKGRRPAEGSGGDELSARWESCLRVKEGQRIALQLTSRDGSRLFIDGVQVIDNWGSHPRRTRGTELTLKAGVHPMRVEYSGLLESASVTLAASFDHERPRRIAPERLRLPEGDREGSCGVNTGK